MRTAVSFLTFKRLGVVSRAFTMTNPGRQDLFNFLRLEKTPFSLKRFFFLGEVRAKIRVSCAFWLSLGSSMIRLYRSNLFACAITECLDLSHQSLSNIAPSLIVLNNPNSMYITFQVPISTFLIGTSTFGNT